MAEIRCVLWNCSGLLLTSSAEEKMDFLATNTNPNFDILVLIETHHKNINDLPSRLHMLTNNFQLLHTPAGINDSYAGIVILVSNRLSIIKRSVLIPGRLLYFKVKNENEEYNISALYGYTSNNASQ